MRWNWILMPVLLSAVICLGIAAMASGQDAQQGGDVMWAPAPAGQDSGAQRGPREGRRPGVFGKITALGNDSIEVTGPDGNKVALKLTNSTEYRKDRQPAKLSDFKVGDAVMVRTDPNGNPATAVMVAGATEGFMMRSGPGGPGGPGGAGMLGGTLGKDFVIGEVKAVDPPKLTVLRTDRVSQTLELNEETSLRRGRESITMADIQAGDHVVAHGSLENNVFVPKNLNVLSPEMWKRIQEMSVGGGASAAGAPAAPNPPEPPPSPKSPPEPQS